MTNDAKRGSGMKEIQKTDDFEDEDDDVSVEIEVGLSVEDKFDDL